MKRPPVSTTQTTTTRCPWTPLLTLLLAWMATTASADYPNTNATKFVQWPDMFPYSTTNVVLDVNATASYWVADDFKCTNSGPITDIHLWGGWLYDQMDPYAFFTLGIWSDVPATNNGTTFIPSHPGTNLWSAYVWPFQYTARSVFTNYELFLDPGVGPDGASQTLWQYNIYPTNLPFSQQGTPTNPITYWLSVNVYSPNNNTFGWKNSTNHYGDKAVYSPTGPGGWQPIDGPAGTNYNLDLAFALTTTPGVSTNQPLPCVESNGTKYVQWPNLYQGFDVWDSSSRPPQATENPWVLADDFVCTNTGPISDIHLWGSWQYDLARTNTITFWLGVYANVPASPSNSFSHPGNLLWSQTFAPGHYAEQILTTNAIETFFDPGVPTLYLGPDSTVWYYCFYPTNLAQTNGNTYWLAAFAQLPTGTTNVFGWKTTLTVTNDISVFAPWPGFGPTNSLGWAPTYSPYGGPLDLAFMLTTTQTNPPTPPCCPESGGPKYTQLPNLTNGIDVNATFIPADPMELANWVLADDFPCTNVGPITDIHIWGSWLNNFIDPNATFRLAIWTDVPTNAANPFSHPGQRLWTQSYSNNQYIVCGPTNRFEGFYDGDSYFAGSPSLLGYSSNLYYYCFYVDPATAFIQRGTQTAKTNYWLSLTVISPYSSFFGWKSSSMSYNDAAVSAPIGPEPSPADWGPMKDPNGVPINLAFKLTTTNCPGPALYCNDMKVYSCSGWSPGFPTVVDPCCGPNQIPVIVGVTNFGQCPQYVQVTWALTNCVGLVGTCTQTITINDTNPPTLTVPVGGDLGCNPAFIPDDAAIASQVFVSDDCGVLRTNVTHVDSNGTGCHSNRVFTVIAYDLCTNATVKYVTYTWTADTQPPIMTCASNKTVSCACLIGTTLPTESVFTRFTGVGGSTPGNGPEAALMLASDGMLYGTTWQGGNSDGGTVFQVKPDGTGYQVLHHFAGLNDGGHPHARLVEGAGGWLYGTATVGGTGNYGTVYALNPKLAAPYGFTVLHNFTFDGTDGIYAYGGLLIGNDGCLYGTTYKGGTGVEGTVYRLGQLIASNCAYQVLHNFSVADHQGYGPYDEPALAQGLDGWIYGTTYNGGTNGAGTVFKLSPTLLTYTVIHHFPNSAADGQNPIGGVMFASDGKLYGETYDGGANGLGTVFKLDPANPYGAGGYTVLHSYPAFLGDGQSLVSGLVEGCDGALYGTTYAGGASGLGTAFRLNKDGTLPTVLYSFAGGTDGWGPYADLLIISSNSMYGTTRYGGTNDQGTLFKLTWGLPFDTPGVQDNCCVSNLLTWVDVTNGTCPKFVTRTWTATDCCSNSKTCAQTLTVVDTSPLLLSCVPSFTTNCGAAWAFIPPTILTNGCCCTNLSLTWNDVTNTGCPVVITRTWTLSDCRGSNAVCSSSAVLTNLGPPVITAAPVGGFLGCNPASLPTDASQLPFVRATDSCGLVSTNITHVDGGTPCLSNRTFTITVKNNCLASASTNVVYTWTVDTTAPSMPCPTNLIVTTCAARVQVAYVNLPTVTDNCSGTVTPVCTPPAMSWFTNRTTTAVHVTATDACGNSTNCTFLVTVQAPTTIEPTITNSSGTYIIRWVSGELRYKDNLTNDYNVDMTTWTPVPSATPPEYHVPAVLAHRFYRVYCTP